MAAKKWKVIGHNPQKWIRGHPNFRLLNSEQTLTKYRDNAETCIKTPCTANHIATPLKN